MQLVLYNGDQTQVVQSSSKPPEPESPPPAPAAQPKPAFGEPRIIFLVVGVRMIQNYRRCSYKDCRTQSPQLRSCRVRAVLLVRWFGSVGIRQACVAFDRLLLKHLYDNVYVLCMCCTVAAAAGCQIASHGQMKLKFLDDNRQERVVEVIRFKIWNYWSSIVAVVIV